MPALCLVPTPLAASRAARRLCDAQGGLLFGPRVATPGELVPALLAAAGERRPLLGALAERLLALDAAREAGGPLAAASSLARDLSRAVAELRRGGVTVEAAASAEAGLEGRAAARLRSLAAVLASYERRLLELGVLDAAGGERAAAEAVRRGAECEATAGLDLLVLDGFARASPAAGDLLAALAARARRTLARLPWFPDRPDLSAPAEALLRRLEALHQGPGEIEIDFPSLSAEGRAPRLAHLLAAVAAGPAHGPAPEGGRVLGLPAAGEEGEAEAAARLLADLLDDGHGPAEVAVVSAAPERSAPLLRRACAARGVPFAAGVGSPLGEVPVVRAVRAALAGAPVPGREAAEALLGSSYLGLARPPARLAFLLDRAGALEGQGDPVAALRDRAARLTAPAAAGEREDLLSAARAVEALAEALRPLASPATPREWARRLRTFLAAAGVRRRAARGEAAVVAQDLAALRRLEEVAEGLADALALCGRGSERLDPGGWRPLLDAALEAAAAPPPPEPAGGAVELWPLSAAAGLSARAVVVLGCRRGAFPPAPRPEALLRDPERAAVNRALRRSALPTSGVRREESLHQAFCALAAARQTLALLWPAGDGASPAPLALEALAAAGVAPSPPAADPPLSRARAPAEALRAAARLGRAGLAGEAVAALRGAPLLSARAGQALAVGALEGERREAVLARAAAPWAGLVPAPLAGALAEALPREWTPSQLEAEARCPYRFFLAEVARVPEPGAAGPDADPRDEGSLLHAALERFVAARRDRGAWPPAGDAADRAEARAAAESVMARFEAEGRVGDPRVWASRREAVLSRMDRFVAAEARLADGLAPRLLEHRFGGASGRPPLVIRDGAEEVRLAGRIDRVDADGERLLVLDYKNGGDERQLASRLAPEALGVTSFQAPLYLMAAARDLPGRSRLAAGYALLRQGARTAGLEVAAGDGLLATDEARRTEARAAGERPVADAVLRAVRRMRRGQFPIASRDCAGCGFGAVCRFQALAEAEP